MWLCTSSRAAASGLARRSGSWKDHDWKTGDNEIWERGVRIDLSKWRRNVQTLCPVRMPPEG